MYEQIRQNRRHRRGKWLYVLLISCLLLCGVTVAMVAHVLAQEHDFKQYIADFSSSTSHAYSQGYLLASLEGRQRQITGDDVHSLYNLIVNCRGIKEQKRPQSQPEVTIDFGDNSQMAFWASKLENSTNGREYGLLIWYQNQEGDTYCYDTDRLDIDRVKLILRRKVDYVQ